MPSRILYFMNIAKVKRRTKLAFVCQSHILYYPNIVKAECNHESKILMIKFLFRTSAIGTSFMALGLVLVTEAYPIIKVIYKRKFPLSYRNRSLYYYANILNFQEIITLFKQKEPMNCSPALFYLKSVTFQPVRPP